RAGRAVHRDGAAMGLDDALAYREAQPRAAPRRALAPPEAVEDARQMLGRDAAAGILDDDLDGVLALEPADQDPAAFGRRFQRVAEQVGNELEQPVAIGFDRL